MTALQRWQTGMILLLEKGGAKKATETPRKSETKDSEKWGRESAESLILKKGERYTIGDPHDFGGQASF